MTLNTNTSVTAKFDRDTTHQVYAPGAAPAYFTTIQEAYNVAADGSTIKTWATTYSESLNCNRPVTVNLQGGYDKDYTAQVDSTVLLGQLTISDGSLIVNNIVLQ